MSNNRGIDNITSMIFTQAIEEYDKFVFETISPFCSRVTRSEISKDELTTALLKEKPAKPVPDGWHGRDLCPMCGAQIFRGNFNGREFENHYCAKCGQRLDFTAGDGKNEPVEPKPIIPQILTCREAFEEVHESPPRYVICNKKTFRDMEIEAGVGYIPKPANKCPSVYGMMVIAPEDGEIIIGNGYVESFHLKGAEE